MATTPNPELVDAVRHYVHFDNLAETLNKQVSNARAKRSEYETKILTSLESSGMRNAMLQIHGATLQRSSKFQATPLSWGFLEEQLHAYYATKGTKGADETPAILEFLQNRRGGKTHEFLKKTTAGSAVPDGKKPPSA